MIGPASSVPANPQLKKKVALNKLNPLARFSGGIKSEAKAYAEAVIINLPYTP